MVTRQSILISLGIILAIMSFGLMSGFFYAFGVSVMPGLNDEGGETAIRAMQGINRAVRNPMFFMTFFLTPVFAILIAGLAFKARCRWPALLMLAVGGIYLAGVIAPTATVNVPLNEALAMLHEMPPAPHPDTVWNGFSASWNFWNWGRTIASMAAMGVSALALALFNRAPITVKA